MEPQQFAADFQYLKKLPGLLIVLQFVCCKIAFLLAVTGLTFYAANSAHGFFIFMTFVTWLTCLVWLVTHVFKLEQIFRIQCNWNKLGLIHNSVFTFFVMIASCALVDNAYTSRLLRAASVFGFLGFTAFLAGVVYEIKVLHVNGGLQQLNKVRSANSTSNNKKKTAAPADTIIENCDQFNSEFERDEDDSDVNCGVTFVASKPRPESQFQDNTWSTPDEVNSTTPSEGLRSSPLRSGTFTIPQTGNGLNY